MKWIDLDDVIQSARDAIDYQKYLTPINFADENKRFLDAYNSGEIYNPTYKYLSFNSDGSYDFDIDESDISGLNKLLFDALQELNVEIEMYKSIGNSTRFTELSKRLYGIPNPMLSAVAEAILTEDMNVTTSTHEDARIISVLELKKAIEQRLIEYGFEWNVILSDKMVAKVSVEPDCKTIFINSTKEYTLSDVKRLIVHEVDTHVLRSENGYLRECFVLAYGTSRSLIHEEGLAIYNEYANNVLDKDTMKLYAGRFLACLNIDLSFYELFDMLKRKRLTESQALYIVSRIKRGISDTSLPGGFIKDYVYFQGFFDVKNAVESESSMYKRMYYGSIGLGECELMSSEICDAINKEEIIYPRRNIEWKF